MIPAHDLRPLLRTRFRPGPLVLATAVWLVLTTATASAHDPGLSALDLGVSRGTIAMSLSLAPADLLLLAEGGSVDRRDALSALAREGIHLSVDGETLYSAGDEVSIDETGGHVRRVFTLPHSIAGHRRLTITSEVPARLERGHRELLVVNMSGVVASQALLDAESDSVAVDLEAQSPSALTVVWSFLKLGNQHILSGYDHLLFLAGLFLAACSVRELVVVLSAFTVAHSISLALVVMGGVHLPASIVEPLIAASIAWVGVENLVRDSRRSRWLVVFGFGLIHGFGFAGALLDLGFGTSVGEVALALVSFNAGVESGQLIVAAAIVPVIWAIRTRPLWQEKLMPIGSLLIAIAGGYWMITRLV